MLHSLLLTLITTIAVAAGLPTAARGGGHEARVREESAPPCGWSGGAIADPAQTQRCLAERFKAAKQPPATNAAAPSAEGTH